MPGERLRVERLAADNGVSSSPVREALHRLSVEGLVVTVEQRGFRVAPMTADGLIDLTRVRLLIETETVADAVRHGSEDWEGAIVAADHLLARHDDAIGEAPGPLDEQWVTSHRTFHLTLFSGSPSPLLVQYATTLFDLADRYRHFAAQRLPRPIGKRDEHRRILDAALSRDADLTALLVRRHIEATAANLVPVLDPAPTT